MRDWRVLSLHQPWASAIAELLKGIETRSWSTKYRGWVAIHAAKQEPTPGHFPAGLFIGHSILRYHDRVVETFTLGNNESGGAELPLGAVVAVARLVDVVPTGSITWVPTDGIAGRRWGVGDRCAAIDDRELPWGDYSEGRFAWLLADVIKLPEPIPAKGKQGLWKPDAELTEQLEAMVGRG